VTDMGAKIDLGPYGGGNVWKKQVIQPSTLVASVYGSAAAQDMDMNAVVTMESPECTLLVVDGRMMEATKAMRISMPAYCGTPDEKEWRAGDDGGVWITPIFLGMYCWLFLRSLGMLSPCLGASFVRDIEPDDIRTLNLISFITEVTKLMFKWMAYAMLAPITTLKVSKDCPQVATTFYSHASQTALTCSWFPLVCFGLFGGLWQAEYFTDRESVKGLLGSACCWGCVFLIWTVIAVTYYIFIMTTCGWEFVFNISLDFSLDWPKFEIAYQIQVTKILLFVLNVLDFCDFLLKIVHKVIASIFGVEPE